MISMNSRKIMSSLWTVGMVLIVLVSATDGMCPRQCKCASTTVRCTSSLLKTVPHFLNPRITSLELTDTSLVRLDNGLDFYVHLVKLNISFSKLQSIGENQFHRLTNLTDLQVEGNEIKRINLGAFHGLHSLYSLNLRGNKISSLDSDVFQGLENLAVLDLSANQLQVVHETSLDSLANLQELRLSKNLIQEFVGWPLPSVTVINLSQNLITKILNSTTTPPLLKGLDLSDNLLSVIEPGSFVSSPALTRLDLSYNKLTDLPQLADPPLSSLAELIFSGNMVRSVSPTSLQGFASLTSLHLNNMPVLTHVLPGTFAGLRSLEVLSLANNKKLVPIPSDSFQGLSKLAVLDLSLLRWTSLNPDQVGEDLSSLRVGGIPLVCSCSLAWLRILVENRPGVVEGAKCDGLNILEVPHSQLQCGDTDYILIIGIVSGSVLIVLLLAVLVILFSCFRSRETKYHCDYLQYLPCEEEKSGGAGHHHQYSTCEDAKPPTSESRFGEEYGLYAAEKLNCFQDPATCLSSPHRQNEVSPLPPPANGGTDLTMASVGHAASLARRPSSRVRNPGPANLFHKDVMYRGEEDLLMTTATPKRHFPVAVSNCNNDNYSEPLYYTVTANPLEEYSSSGYHGSSSLYTDSSASSGGSTLPTQQQHVLSFPDGGFPFQGSSTAAAQLLPAQTQLPPPLNKGQNSFRTLSDWRKEKLTSVIEQRKPRFPDILPFEEKGRRYLV